MVERIAFAFINLEMPTISMGKLKNYLFVKEQGGVSAPHFYCGIQVSRGKLRIGSVSLAPKQAVRYHPSLHWLSDREVSGGFFCSTILHSMVRCSAGRVCCDGHILSTPFLPSLALGLAASGGFPFWHRVCTS
jgi:hypothetical protein